jgi:hypothetical protein
MRKRGNPDSSQRLGQCTLPVVMPSGEASVELAPGAAGAGSSGLAIGVTGSAGLAMGAGSAGLSIGVTGAAIGAAGLAAGTSGSSVRRAALQTRPCLAAARAPAVEKNERQVPHTTQ